jgi:myo-inositol-1-phosphate synthase
MILTADDRRYFINEIIRYQTILFIPTHIDTIDYLSSLNDNKLFYYYKANKDLYIRLRT